MGGPARRIKEPWPRAAGRLQSWWRDHRRVGGESLHFVSSKIASSVLVWLLVGIALALPAGLYLLQANLSDMTASWDGRPGLSVYFAQGASETSIADAGQVLRDDPLVVTIETITPEQALEDFVAHTAVGDALSLLQDNPLPASIRATVAVGTEAPLLEQLSGVLATMPDVQEVVVERTWLERVTEITRVIARLGGVLGALFGVAAVLVTATSVRLAIEDRLEELRVQKLVGATDAQIRRPFLYLGTIYGLGGSVIAAMLIAFTLTVIEAPLSRLAGSYGETLEFSGFSPTFLVVMLIIGCGLGVVGARLAVRQRLQNLDIV